MTYTIPNQDVVVFWSEEQTVGHLVLNTQNYPYYDLIRNLPETQGTTKLPCYIVSQGKKFRNGKQKSWCKTHQCAYGRKKDFEKGHCDNALYPLQYIKNPKCLNVSDYKEGLALWAALPAFYSNKVDYVFKNKSIGVHIHAWENKRKIIDNTVSVLRIPFLDPLSLSYEKDIILTPPALDAYFYAQCNLQKLVALRCTGCLDYHTDLHWFSQNPHSKHQCGNCGKEFFSKTDCVSNALLALRDFEYSPRTYCKPTVHIDISNKDYDEILLWPTSEPLLWTIDKPIVTEGVHLHLLKNGKKIIDETFETVTTNECCFDYASLMNIYKNTSIQELNQSNIYQVKTSKKAIKKESELSYIYFITDGENVKIGKTSNISKRLKSLQTGNSSSLNLLHFFEIDSVSASSLEVKLHNLFAEYKVHGEWFHLAECTIKIIQTRKSIDDLFAVFKDGV